MLKEVFGITLNLRKSSLLLLQLHTVVDPVSFMEPIYQQLPELRQLPLATKGTRIVGVPIGATDYVHDAIRQVLADCDQEFQKVVRFPFANCFILLIRYCCNKKLMYLQRNVSPHIMFIWNPVPLNQEVRTGTDAYVPISVPAEAFLNRLVRTSLH